MSSITFTTVSNTTTTQNTSTKETESTGSVPTTGGGISAPVSNTNIPTGGTEQTQVPRSTNPFAGVTDSKTGARLEDAAANLKDTMKTLNDLIKALRDPDQLATLLVEFTGLQRQQALDQRLASRDVAKAQLEGQAAETREAAVKEIAAAAVALVMAVVSFVVSVVGAVKMAGDVKDGIDAGKGAMEAEKKMGDLEKDVSDVGKQISEVKKLPDSDPTKAGKLDDLAKQQEDLTTQLKETKMESKSLGRDAEASFKKADITMTYTRAIDGLVKGLGDAVSGTLRATAKFDDAQGQVLAANAEDTKADADALKSFMDAIDDLIRTALEFISKINDAEVELMASASRL